MQTIIIYSAIFVVLALIPCIVWMYIYYLKDYKEPEPIYLIWKTFIYGMIVSIPMLILRYLMLEHPEFDLFITFSKYFNSSYVVLFLAFLCIAILEEYFKNLGMLWTVEANKQEFNQIVDGIEYAVAAALGFTFVENIIYLAEASQLVDFGWNYFLIFLIRAFGSTLGHTVFSGTFGYFYAKAKLLPYIKPKDKKLHLFSRHILNGLTFHFTRWHLIPDRKSKSGIYAEAVITEGFLIACGLHVLYDFVVAIELFGVNVSYLVVPMLFFGFIFLSNMFFMKVNTEIIDFTRQKSYRFLTMPERLYWYWKRRK